MRHVKNEESDHSPDKEESKPEPVKVESKTEDTAKKPEVSPEKSFKPAKPTEKDLPNPEGKDQVTLISKELKYLNGPCSDCFSKFKEWENWKRGS